MDEKLIPPTKTENSEESKTPTLPLDQKNSPNSYEIPSIRTFSADVAEAVQDNKISKAKIYVAEQKKENVSEEESPVVVFEKKKNIWKSVLAVLFIFLGVGAIGYVAYYYLIQNPKTSSPRILIEEKTLFNFNLKKEILVNNKTNREIIGEIREVIKNENSLLDNQVLAINLIRVEEVDQAQKKTKLNSQEFLDSIESKIPDEMLRAIDQEMEFGFHLINQTKEPFILFKIKDYELAYANAFKWERFLVSDLRDIFFEKLGSSQLFPEENNDLISEQPELEEDLILATTSNSTSTTVKINSTSTKPTVTSTSTATTTATVKPTQPYDPFKFKDLILANKDTRAIIDNKNNVLFFYTFIDPQTLLITSRLETLVEINKRLNNRIIVK